MQPPRAGNVAAARPTGDSTRRGGSSENSRTSPSHSLPPTPGSSRPPSNSHQAGGPTTTVTKLNVPPQRVKRFQPPSLRSQSFNMPQQGRAGGPGGASPQITRTLSNSGLPAINATGQSNTPPSAVQLASARAAAAARQPQRVQALGNAYGGPGGPGGPGAPPALLQRRPSQQGTPLANRHRRIPGPLQAMQQGAGPPQLSGVVNQPQRMGNRGLPPAAPSARLAARLHAADGGSLP